MSITVKAGLGNSITLDQLPEECDTIGAVIALCRPMLRYGDSVVARIDGVEVGPDRATLGVTEVSIETKANTKG